MKTQENDSGQTPALADAHGSAIRSHAFFASPEFADDYSPEVVRLEIAEELERKWKVLSAFARTAPGRLPSAVQEALAPWEPNASSSATTR